MYYADVEHKGLNKFRRIAGANRYVVEQKALAQRQDWEQQWAKKREVEGARNERMRRAILKDAKKAEALKRTQEAEEELSKLRTIISVGLKGTGKFDWHALYDTKVFSDQRPPGPGPAPSRNAEDFKPRTSLLATIFSGIKARYEAEAETRFREASAAWISAETKYQIDFADWQKKKSAFEQKRTDANAKIDEFRQRYVAKETDTIIEYVDWVLSLSSYPDCFPGQWQINLVAQTGVLVVDYELPAVDTLPKLKGIKYVQIRDIFEETLLRDSELNQLYEDTLYQTCLRTIYEIFRYDEACAINSVTFNGWVNFTDKSTGMPSRACIMSLQSSKEGFQQINLAAVDPKACFRSLKGVGSAKLAGMSAVVPILRFNKIDERFIASHDAIDNVSETTNIAAIPWEEFEFLVRDIFGKEFSNNGGEVKITRASRDHGVDAVAFDPDPIRGGKIVIQAKRYTNIVGVSAVRDLYGTLINEGASRGILVTTSQYGSDSYAFAKDKPITLLDGGNLLSLLERHGHRARIDLAEAKKLAVAREER